MFIFAALFEISTIALVFSFIYSLISTPLEATTFVEKLYTFFPQYGSNKIIAITSILFFILISGLVRTFSIYLTQIISANISIRVSNTVYKNSLSNEYISFNSKEDSKIKSIVLTKINQVVSGYFINSLQLISSLILSSILILVLLIETGSLFIYFALIIFVFYILIYFLIKNRIEIYGNKFVNASNKLALILDDTLKLKQEINIYKVQENFIKIFFKNDSEMRLSLAKSQFIATFPRYLIETISLGTIVLLLLLKVTLNEGNNIDEVSGIVAIGIFGLKLIPSIQVVYSSLTLIKTSTPALLELTKQIDFKKSSFKSNYKYRDIPDKEKIHAITIDKLSHKYINSNSYTFKNLSCAFRLGKSTAITGSSGAGKTTLMNIILGHEKFCEGKINIFTKNNKVFNYDPKILLGRISFVPQKPYLLTTSIKENIYFGRKNLINKNSEEKISKWVKELNLFDTFQKLPKGIETIYGKEIASLSGGQIQKIAILRALVSQPEILIFDEPTSAMDIESLNQFSNILKSLSKHFIIITITHSKKLSELHEEIIRLD
ncbi:ATP-binding cassette domain-containing protein [Prochlorococcus marinus]|uniref:ATP-binding cassette domain-containing protein n=1 Tax=Prochlorococcus marinus TaxID=1219 RepID=UPI001AD98E69|nr:ABC transporter ATP-binding protein [Prochlorococcus marinus]MBO8219543.1 ABC transporter ATP-binding protein [Prochlorococcus marinus CUG1416]